MLTICRIVDGRLWTDDDPEGYPLSHIEDEGGTWERVV